MASELLRSRRPGSVRLLTDLSGAITDTYTYDAFGSLIAATGITPNEHLYGAEQYDASVGFYYLRARYLDPSLGRFLTSDSFEGNSDEPKSLHKYLYAHGNPISNTDPSGHTATSVGELQQVQIVAAVITAISYLFLREVFKDVERKIQELNCSQ